MNRHVEIAFLPAAIEVEQTPASPLGRAIIWLILAFFIVAVIWATLSHVDIVAVAQGRIIPSGHSKTVQPLEIGTVTAIHVREGQVVNAGDILIELDPTSARAEVERSKYQCVKYEQDIAHYRQLLEWVDDDSATSPKPIENTTGPLTASQWREYQDRQGVLEREVAQKVAEQQSAQQQVKKLVATLPIISRRARDQKGLSNKKLLPEQQYLEAEQQRLESQHDLASHKSRVTELDAAVAALKARLKHLESDYQHQLTEKLNEATQSLAFTQMELIKAQARLEAKSITAPVGGTVQQLAAHNVGAVVTPAQVLMVVVPDNGELEVEANLANKDIGFVETGQSAQVKVDAFPFTRYGTIAGRVVDLSADAVADEQQGLVYRMRVALQRATVDVNGKAIPLQPGMRVTVECRTGTRRLIEFLMSPLLKYADESARER